MTVKIYPNTYKDPDGSITGRIRSCLEARGIPYGIYPEDPISDGDFVIAIGGDGTMLQAAREVRNLNAPIIGVNKGALGYLTEVEPDCIEEAIDRIAAGQYYLENRMMLKGRVCFADGSAREDLALNDVVISRCGSLKIQLLRISVNGRFLHEFHADGVILTTPTGSTGYNLSAGGPLLEPTAQLITLTPICPHNLNRNSIVFSGEDEIEVEVLPAKDGGEQMMEASFDGSTVVRLRTGDRILVSRAENVTELLTLRQTSFLDILQEKL
ncbi:MAG: NAD(+)/NADH kinase [Lachnospiraceae bacterium]|nr:NAD(+)/NADH kinase [Lachnospiraceae bacterium]